MFPKVVIEDTQWSVLNLMLANEKCLKSTKPIALLLQLTTAAKAIRLPNICDRAHQGFYR